MEKRSFFEPFPVRVTEGEVFRKYQFLTPCIGIFAGSVISVNVTKGTPSLVRNSFWAANKSYKTFQYTRGTAWNRNICTWGRVHKPHPAYRNLKKMDFLSAGHAGN